MYLLQIEPKSRRLGLEPAHDLDYKVTVRVKRCCEPDAVLAVGSMCKMDCDCGGLWWAYQSDACLPVSSILVLASFGC